MPISSRRAPKKKLSAAVFPWTLAALDRLRRDRRLRSRSEAVAEALAEWAAEYRKDERVEEAVAHYGEAYAKTAAEEEALAVKNLRLSLEHRREP